MCRGSIQEKLQWAFKLYDLNGDGRITKKELTDIVCSVYALMGRRSFSGAEEKALRDHVDKTFMVYREVIFQKGFPTMCCLTIGDDKLPLPISRAHFPFV
ncbi:hypothetical protein TNCV_4016841 [Trichonephila clavipes]|nr:hypothetical protein TNCV_4016841 [Trichonephila clavipes]